MKGPFLKLSKRERYIFYISAIILTVVFLDRVVVRQIVGKLNRLNSETFLQERKLQKSLYILLREKMIAKEYEEYTKHVKQTYSDEEEKARLLSEIEKLARESSVFVANIKSGLAENAKAYKVYTVEIEIESKIDYIIDFIYQLEKSPRLFRVRDFHLIPKENKSEVLKDRMTITEVLISSKEKPSGH